MTFLERRVKLPVLAAIAATAASAREDWKTQSENEFRTGPWWLGFRPNCTLTYEGDSHKDLRQGSKRSTGAGLALKGMGPMGTCAGTAATCTGGL